MSTHTGTPPPTGRRLLDVEAGRGYIGNISREMFYKLVRTHELAIVKIGRRTFVDVRELDRFVDERSVA